MPLLLRGRIVTWSSVLVLSPLAGFAAFFFAWNVSRKWPNPDLTTTVFKIAAMILNSLFAIKCLFMVHSLRLKSKALSFALFCALGVAATIANCCWFAFMIDRRGFDGLCDGDSKACQRRVLSIAFGAFLIVYAILTFLVLLVVFYFDAHWNYAAPNPTTAASPMPSQPYTQISTAQSLRKHLPARLQSWTRFKKEDDKGRHVPLINITHDFENDAGSGKNVVLFDLAGPERLVQDKHARARLREKQDDSASSTSSDDDIGSSEEEAQLEISIDLDPSTGLPKGINTSEFKLEDYPIDNAHRRLKIAMIGAGFSGIIAGIRIDQRLKNVDLQIYEKNHQVGGTWFENSYPGLACDIPAHCYSLTFAPNYNWTKFYAPGPEIRQYLEDVAAKYRLDRFIKYLHKLTRAEWNEETAQWSLSFDLMNEAGDKIGEKVETADVVLQGMGGLSRWDWPSIPGIHDFKGKKLHSAAYTEGAEEQKGKTVAVIGSGSSSIQIVPALQPHATRVDNYVRGSTWIAAPFASSQLLARQPNGSNHVFSEEEKKFWSENPEEYHKFRKSMEKELNSVHGVTMKGSELQLGAVEAFRELMVKKLEKKPHIAEKLIPTFPVACRRLTPGPGYLEALVEDNVDFISNPIKRITETGIETADGNHREYDTIVTATGFDTSYRPRIPIIGRNGSNVQDLWGDVPKHYLSMAIGPDHPNFFVINGPNSSLGSGSLLVMFEREVDYVVQCIAKMQRENYKTMAAKQEAVDDFMTYIETYFKKTVYSEKCRSWYKKGLEEGPVVALWPGSCLHAIKTLKYPRWEDFDFTSSSPQQNRFGWLGDGWTLEEKEGGEGDTAFYLEGIDVPPVPAVAQKAINGTNAINGVKHVNGVNGTTRVNGHTVETAA
ncbi:flavin-containing monooxygenase [Sporobolomyces koalae]|uniref:flavin-containing monooxygenase n=1 Tax=Sporobolomyces koalae TaxID=500713 RepID=UPI003172E807